MTRIEAKEFLESSLGITEPTKEQIDSYLNRVNGEIQKEKDRAEQYKKESAKVAELQEQLDALNSANLSDIEKANNETKKANTRIAELEQLLTQMRTKSSLSDIGIVGEEADKLIESLKGGSLDASILGEIISNRTKTAVADYERKALESTPNPTGSQSTPDIKSEADKLAEGYVKSQGDNSKSSADIVSAYM